MDHERIKEHWRNWAATFGTGLNATTRTGTAKAMEIDALTPGMASVTLGYSDPDVNATVAAQLEDGKVYTLSHGLETEVVELPCEVVPSTEMVHFGRNGSEATAGAIGIARAFTGRDDVLICGYHGSQDWYIGWTARNKGVPTAKPMWMPCSRPTTPSFPSCGRRSTTGRSVNTSNASRWSRCSAFVDA
jgi:4-aminobutyrate aminotransferase-like enzyme